MPIESIQTPKAPKDWKLSSDQRAQIAADTRLQRLSRDEQYAYFNRTPARPQPQRQQAQPQPAPRPAPVGGGLFGWVDQIIAALRGT